MSEKPLMAYMVFDGSDPGWEICFLVFAHSRNQARSHISKAGWEGFDEYVYLGARRKPAFDQYAVGDKPYTIETNGDLPDGVGFYMEPEDWC